MLYIRMHAKLPINQKPIYVQKLLSIKHMQSIEFNEETNILCIQMKDKHVEVITDENPNEVKRVFYDLIKEARSSGKVIEL